MGPKGPFTFLKWAEEYGDIFRVQFMDTVAVVLTNPDAIARISKKTGMSGRLRAEFSMNCTPAVLDRQQIMPAAVCML
jgi:hypothetical protein